MAPEYNGRTMNDQAIIGEVLAAIDAQDWQRPA